MATAVPKARRRSAETHLDEMITREYALVEINGGYSAMHDGSNVRGAIRSDSGPAAGQA
jgi:Zn-dependent alcohol dehydrogenase